MVPLLLALAVASSPSDAVFDAAIEAHRKAGRASVTIVVDSKVKAKVASYRYLLAYVRPDALRLDIQESKPVPSTRTFYLGGGRIVAYDHDSNEVVRRPLGTHGSLLERSSGVLGRMEEAVQVAFDPTASSRFLSRFRTVKKWRLSAQDGLVVLLVRVPKGTVRIGFDRRSHLMREFTAKGTDRYFHWSFGYGPAPSSVVYAAPSFAKPVGFPQAEPGRRSTPTTNLGGLPRHPCEPTTNSGASSSRSTRTARPRTFGSPTAECPSRGRPRSGASTGMICGS